MSRFKKSEYRTEKRNSPVDKPVAFTKCQGEMGLCKQKKSLLACAKCGKPYCKEHLKEHPRFCLGILS